MNQDGDSQMRQPPAHGTKHSSLPISRASGSAYERPERAQTRTSHACEPCRERKTKCDGERPSCRRCLHTGTSCHYGYGKGWRKRKTAEDLSATSRRLQRYEALLAEILPLVSHQVRGIIEDARTEEDGSPPSDMTDGDTPMTSTSSINSHEPKRRAALPLPMAISAPPGGSPRIPSMPSMPSLSTYDSVSSSNSPGQLAHGLHRSSEDMSNRLPSIRPDGTLLDCHRAQLLDGLQSGIPIDPRMSHHSSDPMTATQGNLESPFQKHNSTVEVSLQRSAPV